MAQVVDGNSGQTEKTEVEYAEYMVSQLIGDLEDNAMKAKTTYKDKYVKITGKLINIDSSGKYISLSAGDNSFSFYSVQCYLKNEEQKDKVMNMSTGDSVTLSGKIKDVGEILGYQLDIDSIE